MGAFPGRGSLICINESIFYLIEKTTDALDRGIHLSFNGGNGFLTNH